MTDLFQTSGKMSSGINCRKIGKPQVEIYRPGSGLWRKSANSKEDVCGEPPPNRHDECNSKKNVNSEFNRNTSFQLSNDFDKLSVSKNSHRKERTTTDVQRRTKKPEAAIYIPPRQSAPVQNNNENKRYKSTNYIDGKSGETIRQDDGQFRRDLHSYKKDCELTRTNEIQKSDKLSVKNESFKKPRRPKKSDKKNVKDENKRHCNINNERTITPLMEAKFEDKFLKHVGRKNDTAGQDSDECTTTDSERLTTTRECIQVSETQLLPLKRPNILAENSARDSYIGEEEDHSWDHNRLSQRPPLGTNGRTNNKIYSRNKHFSNSFESLPPRLQKKKMERNRDQDNFLCSATENSYLGSHPDLSLCNSDYNPSYNISSVTTSVPMTDSESHNLNLKPTFIGANSEDPSWDGSCSVTFQGSNCNKSTNTPVLSRAPPYVYTQIPAPPLWSQTLPIVKSRGRGRVPHHELEKERIAFEEARVKREQVSSTVEDNHRNQNVTFSYPTDLVNNERYAVSEREYVNYHDVAGPSQHRNKQLITGPAQNNNTDLQSYEKNNAVCKQKSPVPPQSPLDPPLKKTPVTGMNWADEVELSEQLQEDSTEEKEFQSNSFMCSTNNVVKTSSNEPTFMTHKERRRRRKLKKIKQRNNGSPNREQHHQHGRRISVDVEESQPTTSGSRKNSGDERHSVSRSSRNSRDDRNWSRSRKNSEDDRNWRKDENKDPCDNSYRSHSRANSRTNSQESSRNNSAERWTHEEYHRFNGSEWKFRGNDTDHSRRGDFKGSNHTDRYHPRRKGSRDYSGDRKKEQPKQEENWREEARRLNGPYIDGDVKKQQKPPGILILPQSPSPSKEEVQTKQPPVAHLKKQLFDPSNPQRPLIVSPSNESYRLIGHACFSGGQHHAVFMNSQPPDSLAHAMHNSNLLKEAELIDFQLNRLIRFLMTHSWNQFHDEIAKRRARLQEIMWILLTSDIRFCEQDNLETRFWKILYYNLLEWCRNQMALNPQNRDMLLGFMINICAEGKQYYENTLKVLEETYKFRLEEYLSSTVTPAKNKHHLTMALLSAQKVLIFLGNLSRIQESAQDTDNYGVARQWYLKAQQLNPKNGLPYYQLAILAVYVRRFVDAVYYNMRSFLAATAVGSPKENLLAIFDENRRKYENSERQRETERELRNKEKMKEKEFDSKKSTQLRREIWIHPDGGRRVHRTTSTSQQELDDSEAELEAMSNSDLSKRFSLSFLHVHGKLFTKIGMESFNGVGVQMLRELRVLLQHSPLSLHSARLVQLLAINMFAIEYTQLKSNELGPGYRSALQEAALVTSLQMFNLLVERAAQLLRDQHNRGLMYRLIVSDDVNCLLPAIKVWCDWLLVHSAVWNPPPSCNDFQLSSSGDLWSKLAVLVNFLDQLDYPQSLISEDRLDGYREVRLDEDVALAGFNPLLYLSANPMYTSPDSNMEMAKVVLRIHRILFCGTVFLCGVDPPVLKLHKNASGTSEYISVVETPSPPTQSDTELCVESISGDEGEDSSQVSQDEDDAPPIGEVQSLLQRKQQLERSHRRQEKRQQRVQDILQKSMVSVEIEVRPHYLVADTNCFIDYLPQLQLIARTYSPTCLHVYTVMVPLVVLNELDGLAHGRRCASSQPAHLAMVTECAASALEFLRARVTPAIRCVTTKGTILNSTTFTSEEDCEELSNDDKILMTCLKLCHSSSREQLEEQPKRIIRDVVLLTEDRNLRVKALAQDVPVREVPDFIKWAGLGLG